MKKTTQLFAVLFILFLAVGAKAQTSGADYFAGKWNVLVKGLPNGDTKMFFVLEKKDTTITGDVTISYVNNSPDQLEYVWLQLDQNLFNPNSRGVAATPAINDLNRWVSPRSRPNGVSIASCFSRRRALASGSAARFSTMRRFDKATAADANSWTSSTNGASFLVSRLTSVPYRCRAAPAKR